MPDTEQTLLAARRLLRERLQGVLSTHSLACPGYPFGSLVPYCLDLSAAPVLLLSHLAQHTKNLQADPRVALHITESGEGDAQTLQRLALVGEVQGQENVDSDARERYFRFFPQARTYHDELNFRFFRLQALRCHWVGGFGAARWLAPERVLAPPGFPATEEAALVERLNQVGFTNFRARLIPSGEGSSDTEATRVVGIDRLGIDARCGDRLVRLGFPEPAASAREAAELLLGGASPWGSAPFHAL